MRRLDSTARFARNLTKSEFKRNFWSGDQDHEVAASNARRHAMLMETKASWTARRIEAEAASARERARVSAIISEKKKNKEFAREAANDDGADIRVA